jgi:hypothetical protein
MPAPQPVAEPAAVGVMDIYATAFRRFGGGFATFGLLALALALLPVAVYLGTRAAGASRTVVSWSFVLAAVISWMALVGAVTAVVGGRLRRTAAHVVGTALLVAPFLAAIVIAVGPYALVPIAFLLPFVALAPVAAGAGDCAGLAACRRALRLTAGGYRRAVVVSGLLVVLGAVLLVSFNLALAPLPSPARGIVALLAWTAVYGPISALVLRALYGALSGRLVVRR